MATDDSPTRSSAIPARPSLYNERSLWCIIFLVSLVWCARQTGIGEREWLNLGGLPQVRQFFRAALSPEISTDFLQLTENGSLEQAVVESRIGNANPEGGRKHWLMGDTVDDNMADPERIAELYLQLHRQHRSTWACEVVVRPWVENW